MELRIDLGDRAEIAAAIPLLQLIHDQTGPGACGGQCSGGLPVPGPTAQDLGRPLTAVEAEAATFGAANVPPPPFAGYDPNFCPGSNPENPQPYVDPAPAAPVGVELDKNGLPWDERIHASTKTKTVDGAWKMKRGVSPEKVAQVEAELRARVAAPLAPATPTATAGSPLPSASSVPPMAPGAVDPAAVFGGAPAAPLAPPSGAPTLPPNPPVAPASATSPTDSGSPVADPATFEQLMPRVTAACTAGTLPPTALGAACTSVGLTGIVQLQQAPQYVPLVWATLRQSYPALA